MADAETASHPEEYLHEGNWAPMYVFVALIPLIAVAVMVYSNWADRASERAGTDVEMAANYASVYERTWFPWRDAVSASEGAGARAQTRASPPSSTKATVGARPRPRPRPTKPPVLPASFRPAGAGSGGRQQSSSTANSAIKKHLAAGNVSVTVTAPTPEPELRVPKPAAVYPYRPSRPPRSPQQQQQQQPYEHFGSANERWGEGPYGYGSRSSRRDTTQRTLTSTRRRPEPEFQDVPF